MSNIVSNITGRNSYTTTHHVSVGYDDIKERDSARTLDKTRLWTSLIQDEFLIKKEDSALTTQNVCTHWHIQLKLLAVIVVVGGGWHGGIYIRYKVRQAGNETLCLKVKEEMVLFHLSKNLHCENLSSVLLLHELHLTKSTAANRLDGIEILQRQFCAANAQKFCFTHLERKCDVGGRNRMRRSDQ